MKHVFASSGFASLLEHHTVRQQFLYFLPLPQGHGSFRPVFLGGKASRERGIGARFGQIAITSSICGSGCQSFSITSAPRTLPVAVSSKRPYQASARTEYFRALQ